MRPPLTTMSVRPMKLMVAVLRAAVHGLTKGELWVTSFTICVLVTTLAPGTGSGCGVAGCTLGVGWLAPTSAAAALLRITRSITPTVHAPTVMAEMIVRLPRCMEHPLSEHCSVSFLAPNNLRNTTLPV